MKIWINVVYLCGKNIKLDLPRSMHVDIVFHASMLRWCLRDVTQVIPHKETEMVDGCTYVVKPLAILDYETKNTGNKWIGLMKMQWSEDPGDVTWKHRDLKKSLYPELFGRSTPITRVTHARGQVKF